jgi:hypothetical protein
LLRGEDPELPRLPPEKAGLAALAAAIGVLFRELAGLFR